MPSDVAVVTNVDDDDMIPWVIVGCGRVGTALALLAEQIGVPVAAAWDRDGPPRVPAQQRLSGSLDVLRDVVRDAAVLITVSDDAIAAVAGALAPLLRDAAVVAHCSGSVPSTILTDAGVTAPVVSVHPLLAVADPFAAVHHFPEAAWTIEGSSAGVWWARGWLALIDVDAVTIQPRHKALYHASAVTSAGLLVALMDVAFEFAEAAGISREQARTMLLPLARSTLENLETLSSAEALTGPIARDDEETVDAHIAAMGELSDGSAQEIYEALTARSRRLAQQSGKWRADE